MKSLGTVFLLTLALLLAPAVYVGQHLLEGIPAPTAQVDLQLRSAANVWMVTTVEGALGTAVPVGQKNGVWVFLTCDHVAAGQVLSVELRGRVLYASRHESLKDRDLAIVFVAGDGRDVELVPLAGRAATFGERVMAVGYGLGTLSLSEGRVSERGMCSTSIIFGNSGGPLFDSEGRILGIMARVATNGFSAICHKAQFEPLDGYELSWIRDLCGLTPS